MQLRRLFICDTFVMRRLYRWNPYPQQTLTLCIPWIGLPKPYDPDRCAGM